MRLAVACLVLFYGLVLACGSRSGFPTSLITARWSMPYLADKPLGEDGFYVLTVAWHLANGHGLTYNFGQIVTGLQPLATVIDAALAWLVIACGGGKWAFARSVLVLQPILLVIFASLVGRIARRLAVTAADEAQTAAFCLAALSFALFRWADYGLETIVYLILIAICVVFTLAVPSPGWRSREAVTFGILCGLAGLARIDFGVVLAAYLGLAIWQRQLQIRYALLAGICALLVVAPWLLWVHDASGRWMPSSGPVEFSRVTVASLGPRAQAILAALAQAALPMLYVEGIRTEIPRLWPSASAAVLTLFCAGALVAVTAMLRPWPATTALSRSTRDRFMRWLPPLLILVCVYPVISWATHFYVRYAMPLLVISIPLLAARLGVLAGPISRPRTLAWLLAFIFAAFAIPSLHMGHVGNVHALSAGYVQKEVPASTKVGAFQSGVIGYFNENVVNLDGKMNPIALARAERGELASYVDEEGLARLVDWASVIRGNFSSEYLARAWEACPRSIPGGRSICLERRP